MRLKPSLSTFNDTVLNGNFGIKKTRYRYKVPEVETEEQNHREEDTTVGWKQRRDIARGSVANLFKVARNGPRQSEDGERLPARVVSRTPKPAGKSSLPLFDISDEVLEIMMDQPEDPSKKATEKFYAQQRQRANLIDVVTPQSTSTREPSQAELDRKPLSPEDLIAMFAGSPYFDVDHRNHRPKPRVVLGWGPSTQKVTKVTDCADFQHKSFEACSLQQTLSQPEAKSLASILGDSTTEFPSMLNPDGKDPGTVGYAHFLEMPLMAQHLSQHEHRAVGKRRLLISDPNGLGLQQLNGQYIIDRLAEISATSAPIEQDWEESEIEDIGMSLFTNLLSNSQETASDGEDGLSLKSQVKALCKALAVEDLWYDFTVPEWRFKIGEILWTDHYDSARTNEKKQASGRDVLLLQILLSSELLLRLCTANILSGGKAQDGEQSSSISDQATTAGLTDKIQWDLVLALCFLQSFSITSRNPHESNTCRKAKHISILSFKTAKEHFDDSETVLTLQPRNGARQLDGVLFFARNIGWPDSVDVNENLAALLQRWPDLPIAAGSEYATPTDSPTIPKLPDWVSTLSGTPIAAPAGGQPLPPPPPPPRDVTRDGIQLSSTAERRNSSNFGDAGWLSRSWMSGLLLPGASTSQLLLATMLESSPRAISALGGTADLQSGFFYRGRMYWSKSSVVGRVLAAYPGARECMGWISPPEMPTAQSDGWVKTYAKPHPYASINPRINTERAVSRASDPLHTNDAADLQAGDFITPIDGHPVMGNDARFEGISFEPVASLQPEQTDTAIQSRTAKLTFRSPTNPKLPALTIPLLHSVHFVSSYPCYPLVARRQRNTYPFPAQDPSPPMDSGHTSPVSVLTEKDLPSLPAHPLHVDYTFTVIPAATLLSAAMPEPAQASMLSMPGDLPSGSASSYRVEDEEVVVLDCRGGGDLELLARAWCAKVGEHALIGPAGRTCLACCIREAMGLGIGVVIRI